MVMARVWRGMIGWRGGSWWIPKDEDSIFRAGIVAEKLVDPRFDGVVLPVGHISVSDANQLGARNDVQFCQHPMHFVAQIESFCVIGTRFEIRTQVGPFPVDRDCGASSVVLIHEVREWTGWSTVEIRLVECRNSK